MATRSVCIVTGAGSGLGRALALRLSSGRWNVALVGRRKERLLETRTECVEAGGSDSEPLVLPVDITEPGAAQRVVSDTIAAFGQLDAVVNNAAHARFAAVERTDAADLENMLRTNLIAPLMLIKHAVPELRRQEGHIVNVGSIGGLLALPGRSGYGASKAALHHLTRSLARELAPRIRVNAVVPGAVDTELYDNVGLDPQHVAELRAEMVRTTPLGRIGTPDDVVPLIELLLSTSGRWMTGSLLVADGGRAC